MALRLSIQSNHEFNSLLEFAKEFKNVFFNKFFFLGNQEKSGEPFFWEQKGFPRTPS